jgi:hypothetical protein
VARPLLYRRLRIIIGPGGATVETRRLALGVGVGLYLVGLGVLGGMALDRMRYDHQRSEVLARYEQGLTRLNALRMALEQLAGAEQ